MAMNLGIQNEIEIEHSLDMHRFIDLNPNLKAFINGIFHPSPEQKRTEIIHAHRTGDTRYKPDLILNYLSKTQNISIKMGSGNSVHQESIGSFANYIKTELGAAPEEVAALLFFHWGDGTLDGSAPVAARMPAREIIEKYPEKITLIQRFFNRHEDELLERFLSTGISNLAPVDWIYYGNNLVASWHNISDVYASLKANPANVLSVGGLNFQTYGRSLNGQDDKRREGIQLKWSNMSAFFLTNQKSIINLGSKIKGDNSHGFQNVENIITTISGKHFSDLPDTLKEFVLEIFQENHDTGKATEKDVSEITENNTNLSTDSLAKEFTNQVFHAEKAKSECKGDFLIWPEDNPQNVKNIAVAMGAGNSVHQEKIDSFCSFLKNLGISDEVVELFLRFHFADGTPDNTGAIEARQSASEYKKYHTDELQKITEEFSKHSREIIEHFIKKNPDNYPDVDYFFYGDTKLPYWAKIETLINNEITKQPNPRATLAIGDFSIQAWNRSLNGAADHKRLNMQVKWNNLRENILQAKSDKSTKSTENDGIAESAKNIRSVKNTEEKLVETINQENISLAENKALQGLNFEYKFTTELNQNKQNLLWRNFDTENKNLFFINVSFNQISKIAGSKVRPKSDCYVVKIVKNIEKLLHDHNFVLTEEILREEHIPFEVIPSSGVSIKLPEAKHYTLQKLSYSAFQNIFTNIPASTFVAALLFIDSEQVAKNDLIFATFKTSLDQLCRDLKISRSNSNIETCKILKATATQTIEKLVNENSEYYNAICFGEGIFEDPYAASHIFENGQLLTKDKYRIEISVTTGSGRSRGIYNLAFK